MDTKKLEKFVFAGGYADHTSVKYDGQYLKCTGTKKNQHQCKRLPVGRKVKAIILSIDFNPRAGKAYRKQWFRNQYSLKGSKLALHCLPGKKSESGVATTCPSSHPYAYLNGASCCSTHNEKVSPALGVNCDGSIISFTSKCCSGSTIRCKGERCFDYIVKGIKHAFVCEHGDMRLACPANQHIEVMHAMYGRRSKTFCRDNSNKNPNLNCRSATANTVVATNCKKRSSCRVKASNKVFRGDPCRGTYKYLDVAYVCVPVTPCDIRNGGCDHSCASNGVVVQCFCKIGFKLAADQRTCIDDRAKPLVRRVGCFRDSRARAVSTHYTKHNPKTVIENCYIEARNKGNQYFAVQYNKQCFTSDHACVTYSKYGVSRRCRNGRGNSWTNSVYQVKPPGNTKSVTNDIRYAGRRQIPIEKNTHVATLAHLNKVYSIQFEVLPTEIKAGWRNVLHLTTGKNTGVYGYRAPGVWFKAGWRAKKGKLHICSAISGRYNKCYISKYRFPASKWIKIKISQVEYGAGYLYRIFLNKKQVYRVKNTKAEKFQEVKVFASDPWYAPQPGYIKGLSIQGVCDEANDVNLVLDKKQLAFGRKLTTLSTLHREYSIQFEVNPTSFLTNKKWTSVLHFTIGGNTRYVGTRIPGIFVAPGTSTGKRALYIVSSVGRNWHGVRCKIPRNKWTGVKVSQNKAGAGYWYRVEVNGRRLKNVRNLKPREFKNVKVYASDPWYPAQPGYIRRLTVHGGCRHPLKRLSKIPTIIPIKKGVLVTTLSKLHKEYSVEFEVLPTEFCKWSGWLHRTCASSKKKLYSVLHLTTGVDTGVRGARIPAVFVLERSKHKWKKNKELQRHRKVSIATSIGNNWNYAYHSRDIGIPLGKWTKVRISQRLVKGKYKYEIALNGKRVQYVTNSNPREFKNVKVYASDPWYPAQKGFIKGLTITGACFK